MTVTLSIVSHNQFSLTKLLLDDLEKHCQNTIKVILTENVPNDIPTKLLHYTYPIEVIRNTESKGFAENHNAAFKKTNTPYFCVLNPDIRLLDNPFPVLIENLADKHIGVVAPLVIDEQGKIQDTARKLITPARLLKRFILRNRHPEYPITSPCIYPDWVAGMFMLFDQHIYKQIQGFDEAYFLYCEDMDICQRLSSINYKICLNTQTKVIHHARRYSHFKPKYFYWHCQSLMHYFRKKIRQRYLQDS